MSAAVVTVNPLVGLLVKGPTPLVFVEIKGGVLGVAALSIKASRDLRRQLLYAERQAMVAAAEHQAKAVLAAAAPEGSA
jgi:hypothetical protein